MNHISVGGLGTPESFALFFLFLLLLFLLTFKNDIMYHRIFLTIHSILIIIKSLSCNAVGIRLANMLPVLW